MPYITASIILQLLQVVVPVAREALQGGRGRPGADHPVHALPDRRPGVRSVDRLRLPVPLAAGSTPAGSIIPVFDLQHIFLIVISLTAGTVLVMWMGELITQRGIGNGISLMIFANIVSRLPGAVRPGTTEQPGLQGRAAVPGARRRRRGRLRPGGPAAHPGAVRQARRRAAHDLGRADLPAAAREHGRRHPGDLRRLADGVPADDRPAPQHASGRSLSRTSSRPAAGTTSSARRC